MTNIPQGYVPPQAQMPMPAADQGFQFGMFTATVTAAGHLVVRMRSRVLADVPASEIASVTATTGMGDRYKCKIVYRKAGVPRRAPPLSSRAEDGQMFAFLAALRRVMPPTVQVADHITPDVRDLAAPRIYPVGGRLMGYTQERWAILLFWWLLVFLIVTIPFAILATRGYRLYTDGNGLRLVRIGTTAMPWSEVAGYRLVTINRTMNGSRVSSMLRFTIEGRKRITFSLTGIAGTKFHAELQARGIRAL